MPAFCPNCWKELPPGRDDCPVCGQRVTKGPYTGDYKPWSPFWVMILDGWNAYFIIGFILLAGSLLLLLLFLR